jgi:hypothetical protein
MISGDRALTPCVVVFVVSFSEFIKIFAKKAMLSLLLNILIVN